MKSFNQDIWEDIKGMIVYAFKVNINESRGRHKSIRNRGGEEWHRGLFFLEKMTQECDWFISDDLHFHVGLCSPGSWLYGSRRAELMTEGHQSSPGRALFCQGPRLSALSRGPQWHCSDNLSTTSKFSDPEQVEVRGPFPNVTGDHSRLRTDPALGVSRVAGRQEFQTGPTSS